MPLLLNEQSRLTPSAERKPVRKQHRGREHGFARRGLRREEERRGGGERGGMGGEAMGDTWRVAFVFMIFWWGTNEGME